MNNYLKMYTQNPAKAEYSEIYNKKVKISLNIMSLKKSNNIKIELKSGDSINIQGFRSESSISNKIC